MASAPPAPPAAISTSELVAEHLLTADLADAADLARSAKAAATQAAYRSDWIAFCAWCASRGVDCEQATAADVAAHLANLFAAGKRIATVRRARSGIAAWLAAAGRTDRPTSSEQVRLVLKGAGRQAALAGQAAPDQAPALLLPQIAAMVAALDCSRISETAQVRDAALLLVGWAGALRRSEIAALDISDISETTQGLQIRIGRSKTDQLGEGATVCVAFSPDPAVCPIRAWRAWRALMAAAGIAQGPAFPRVLRTGEITADRLSGAAVGELVTRAASRARIEGVTGHSLRAGCLTQMAQNGCAESSIAIHSRHASVATLRMYTSRAGLWEQTPAASLWGRL